MKGQVGMQLTVGRLVAPVVIFAPLLGTAWTGRASDARVDVDPALHTGDVALIQVAAGTAWTVAADLKTWEPSGGESVSWEAITWEGVVWESVSWEGVMWETVGWEQLDAMDVSR